MVLKGYIHIIVTTHSKHRDTNKYFCAYLVTMSLIVKVDNV